MNDDELGPARIEDFEAGQHVSCSKTFTEEDLENFIAITGDMNPIHTDEQYAASTKFGKRILHGLLTASMFSTLVGMFLPGKGAIYRAQTLRFLLPVYPGETLTAHFVVRSVDREKHRIEIDAWIENEDGDHVIEGESEAGLLRVSG